METPVCCRSRSLCRAASHAGSSTRHLVPNLLEDLEVPLFVAKLLTGIPLQHLIEDSEVFLVVLRQELYDVSTPFFVPLLVVLLFVPPGGTGSIRRTVLAV